MIVAMLVPRMPRIVARHVNDGVAAMLSGNRFQVTDDCIVYKLDSDEASERKLKRSSTPAFSDIAWSVSGDRINS